MQRIFVGILFATGLIAQSKQSPELHNLAAADFSNLPLAFEQQGSESNGRFLARGRGYAIGIDHGQLTLAAGAHAVSLAFAGVRADVTALAGPELPGKINEIRGNDPKKWRIGIPAYVRVSYTDVYPGIDVVWYGNQQQLEFDLIVKPGADPESIHLKIGGADKLSLDASGALTIDGFRIALPRIYQDVNGSRRNIPGRYVLRGRDEVAFEIDPYDTGQDLVIDPTIVYSTLLSGGPDGGSANGVGLDASGNILVAGSTTDPDFPVVNAFQNAPNGFANVFVTKINPAGTELLYSTFFGGSGTDLGYGLAVDSTGAVWVTGSTSSTDFPLLNPTQSTLQSGSTNAFLFRLDTSGVPQFSTYLGGSASSGQGVAADAMNNGYVTGYNQSGSFPTTAGVVQPNSGATFVTKFGPTGTQVYSTLLGGSSTYGSAIAVDSGGSAYITGNSYDSTFPAMPSGGAQTTNNGAGDAFVAKLSPDASALTYFTFLGGAGPDQGKAIAVDSSFNAYVSGSTGSTGLATTGAYQTSLTGDANGFAAELNPTGSAFTWFTYLGGNRNDAVNAIALDGSDNVYLAGTTDSLSFPAVSAIQSTPAGLTSLYSSTNSAASFAGADSNIPGAVAALSINPATESEVALTDSGIYRSTDGGNTWSQSLEEESLSLLSRSPASPSTLYAIRGATGFYSSTDDGVTWNAGADVPIATQGLIADPLNAATAYASSYAMFPSVYVTTDGGNSWTADANGLIGPVFAMTATTDGVIYAAASTGLFISTNQGGSWTAADTGIAANTVFATNSLSASGTRVFIVGESAQNPQTTSIYTTTNDGAQWSALSADINAAQIAVSPQNASVLYALTENNTVLASSDGGMSWSAPATGLGPNVTASNFVQLLVDPQNSAHVLVVAYPSESAFVAKLAAGGAALTWSSYLSGPASTYAYGIATDGTGNAFVAGTTSGPGFPVTANALPSGPAGAFVTKISDATASCSTLTLTPASAWVPSTGGTLTFAVIAPAGCAWTTFPNEPWVVITSGNSGTGTGNITAAVLPYPDASGIYSQEALLWVNSSFATITQPDSSCTYTLPGKPITIGPNGGVTTFNITASSGCVWAITNNSPGAISVSPSSGEGNATIQVTVTPNRSSGAIALSVSVGGQLITIDQSGGTAEPQTITFPAIPNQVPGAAPFTITATASSRLLVSLTSTTPAVCSVADFTVAVLAAGLCSITANQAGGGVYAAAPAVIQSFYVQVPGPAPTLVSSTNPSVFGQPVTLTATISGGAGGMVTFYDGTNILGSAALSNGSAVLSTIAVGLGQRKLSARYFGGSYTTTASTTLAQTVTTNPGGGFKLNFSTPVIGGFGAKIIAVADLNHDGYPDIAQVDNASVLIYINNGNGTFQNAVSYSAGGTQISIADINLDGNPDLVLNGNRALLGNGNGTFQSSTVLANVPSLSSVRIADINSDGIPDIIGFSETSIQVCLGNGDGTYQTPIAAATSAIGAVGDLEIGDFNGDGIPDAAITNGAAVSIMFGTGTGTFTFSANYAVVADTIALADVNNDGILDIIGGAGLKDVLLGQPDGTFSEPMAPATGKPLASAGAFAPTITDVDGDGNPDLIQAGQLGGSVYFGNGDGTFGAAVGISMGQNVFVTVGDFNGDGIVDLVATGPSLLSIYNGALAPRFTLTAAQNPVPAGQNVVLTVTASRSDATGTVTLNGTVAAPVTMALSNGSATFTIAKPAFGDYSYEVTYSGNSQYAATSSNTLAVAVNKTIGIKLTASPNPAYPGQQVTLTVTAASAEDGGSTVAFRDGITPLGSATFGATSTTSYTETSFTTTFTAGVHQITAETLPLLGLGSASATATLNVVALPGGQLVSGAGYQLGSTPTAMVAGDFTGDGLIDIAALSATGQSLTLLAGDGYGIFVLTPPTQLGFVPGAMIAVTGDQTTGQGAQLAITAPGENAVYLFSCTTASDDDPPTLPGCTSGEPSYYVGSQPVAIAEADFDGDGITDLVTANAGSNNVSAVLSTIGTIEIPAGTYPDAIVTADFNSDGNADFAVANRNDGTVAAYLGNGDGTFQPPQLTKGLSGPSALATADLNVDGKPDLAVLDGATGQIMILLGNGDGTFNALSPLTVPGATSITLVQLGASAFQSLVVTTGSGLLVFPGNGNGTFGTPAKYPQYAGATAVVAGAFLLNGRMDLAVAPPGANSVSLLLNAPAATATLSPSPATTLLGKEVTFTINVTPATAEGWFTVYDGAVSIGSGIVSAGQGSFTTSLLLPGTHAISAKFAGLGSGLATTSTQNFTVTSLPSSGLGWQPQNPAYPPPILVPGDFNNDGVEDFAFGSVSQIGILLGKPGGSGTFTEITGNLGAIGPMFAVDLNRDGFTDIAYTFNNLEALLNVGHADFVQAPTSVNELYINPTAGAAADLNGDTIPDLVLAGSDGTLEVVLGVGNGTFQTPQSLPAGSNPSSVAIADLNEDGIPDIIVADNISASTGAITVLLGQAGATFSSPRGTIVSGAVSVVLADFNGDHHLDAAIAGNDNVTLLPGNGDGTFGTATTIALPASPLKILAADMNGDGNQDLVVLFTTGTPVFAVLYGNGNGTFQSPVTYNDARIPLDIAVGDINNDGRMDVVVASTILSSPGVPVVGVPGIDVFFGGVQALTVVSGSPQTAPAGKAFKELQVQAPPGTPVTFTAPASGPSGTFASNTSTTVTANSSGIASTPMTANSTGGSYTVVASAPGFLDADFDLTNTGGKPANLSWVNEGSFILATVGNAFSTPVQALVEDVNGIPVPGVTVTFTAPTSGATATFTGGATTGTAVTNAAGIASIVPTANSTQGSYSITAGVSGISSLLSFTVTNFADGEVMVSTSTDIPAEPLGAQLTVLIDGVAYNTTTYFSWKPGDTHSLSASPQQGEYFFAGWSDGGAATHTYTVPSAGAMLIAAYRRKYDVTINQSAGGTITPAGGYYFPGTVLTVTATPDPGYTFSGFNACCGIVPPTNPASFAFTVSEDVTIGATFTPAPTTPTNTLYPVVSHTGDFYQGQIGATYSIVVVNGSSQSSDRTITVTEAPPAGLTVTSMSGPGWTCTGVVCTRSDTLLPGASYPPITATANVAFDAPSQLTNEAFCNPGFFATSVTLGVPGIDPTTIDPAPSTQTISFAALPNLALGASPFNLSATASSGLAVSYLSNSPSVCTISGSTVTIVGGGVCSITASQAGNASYAPATSVTQTFTVSVPYIQFDTISNQILGVSPFAVAAQSNTFLPVAIASNTPTICTTASILVTLLSTGTCSLTATQPGNGTYAASTPVTQTFNIIQANPSGTLTQAAGSPITVASSGPTTANAAAVGDFNGDGIPDLAVVVENLMTPNTVAVLLGNGSGGFTPAPGSPFTVGGEDSIADAIAAGDFNGDGNQDLAVANQMSGNVAVLLGNGAGGFAPAAGSPVSVGAAPYSIVVADFNGDGIQDLATANYFDGDVSILLGNGAGGFTQASGSPIMTGSGTASLAVADFNSDGNPDLAVVIQATPSVVTVLLGNGSGGFAASSGSPFTVGNWARSAVVGDFNGDGIPDLATANSNDNTVTVLLGQGGGNFAPAMNSPYGAGTSPQFISVADFNGDGIPDLAVSNSGSDNVTLLLGNGSGGFSAAVGSPFPVAASPGLLAVSDFNHDGIEDLAIPNGQTVTVLLGSASSTTAVLSTTSASTIPQGQAIPLTLTVTDTAFNPLSGTATFKDGATVLGTASQTTSPFTFNATGLALGAHTFTAVYSGGSGANPSTSNSVKISVLKAQTITFNALPNRSLGTGPFTLTATSNSGLTVTLTSNTPSICSMSGDGVKLLAEGTCSITASQAGNTTYAPATPVTQTFTIGGEQQTITFTAPSNQVMGAKPLTLKATATSKLTVTFVSNSLSVCTVSGDTVTLIGSGTCSITASQPGNSTWAAATPVIQTFNVAGELQTITFPAVGTQTIQTGSIVLSATASSDLTVDFVASTSATCTVSGATLTLVATGTCSITASQPGNSIYAAAKSVTQSFAIEQAQTITFNSLPNLTLGAAPFNINATASSDLAVKLTSNSASVCTVSGTKVTLLAGGICSITASQSGNSTYAPAASVTQTFTVLKTQTIKFTSPGTHALVSGSFTLTATATSGLTVAFSSNSTSICTVSSDTVTLLQTGTCSITASQSGSAVYAPATPVTQTFTVD